MKPINTSNSTFAHLRAEGTLYVDKTLLLYEIISKPLGQYFLARPRRFGKSLMISTLKAIFEGKKELFSNLAIDQCGYEWPTYPIIHLNLGSTIGDTPLELKQQLLYAIKVSARENNIELQETNEILAFHELIHQLHENSGPVVVLVDEYDKPLLGHLAKPSVIEIQEILKNFYSVIKSTESKQRFALITGVSKLSKVSIFSDLNNLTDLSMRKDSATLLGFTQEEIESNFNEYIVSLQ